MHRVLFLAVAVVCLLWPAGSSARDYTAVDYDAPDSAQIEAYQQAVSDLIGALAIVARDDEGDELFRVVPFPLELVALRTQLAVHEGNTIETAELDELIAQANNDKPSANSFAFVVDGHPSWVRRDMAMYYFPHENDLERIQLPVVPAGSPEVTEGAKMVAAWALMATDPDELDAFLSAPRVVLVVGDEEGEESISLECGFWRRWGLFDFRIEEEEGETANPESGS